MDSDEDVFVSSVVLDAIVAHALDEAPRECCGLLMGTGRRIVRAVRARNARRGTTRYLVDVADHFDAVRTARSEGLSIVGAYHSHPVSPPVPSNRDVREAVDGFLYLIAGPSSRGGLRVLAFEARGGNFRPLRLVSST